jgi:hypothetical protein
MLARFSDEGDLLMVMVVMEMLRNLRYELRMTQPPKTRIPTTTPIITGSIFYFLRSS